jgi:hypothetical protein
MMVPHAVNWQVKETLGSSRKTPPTDSVRLVRIIHDGGRTDDDPAAEVVKVLTALRDAIASPNAL